jgi:hypothetical protein
LHLALSLTMMLLCFLCLFLFHDFVDAIDSPQRLRNNPRRRRLL